MAITPILIKILATTC